MCFYITSLFQSNFSGHRAYASSVIYFRRHQFCTRLSARAMVSGVSSLLAISSISLSSRGAHSRGIRNEKCSSKGNGGRQRRCVCARDVAALPPAVRNPHMNRRVTAGKILRAAWYSYTTYYRFENLPMRITFWKLHCSLKSRQ